MNIQKLFSTLLILLLSIVSVYSLWKYPVALILTLIIIMFLKHYLVPLKKEFIMYLVSAVVGAGSESIIMFGGPWTYATANILNFPIWLPFLWGLAGVTGISLYQSISEN